MNTTRPEYIMITVNKAEKEQIRSQAAKADMPMTMYCRKVLLADGKRMDANEQFSTV